ncbi:MAG TPA: patatin-like phospholipase family protein [Candidatus Cryosericum sp.]|jgi:NTE family protein|nr:patatin-like phospholipase family protein [Candidatus Cryosericum sp.]HPS69703.1 patatin-like phospholipase family protein [Candidatus Cryosericum sp.]
MTKVTHRNRIGLALSSGGVLGYAHIGVLRALEELGVPVDMLSGASMGAIVAVFRGAGLDAAALEALALKYGVQVAAILDSLVPLKRLTSPQRLRNSLRGELPVTLFEALEKPVCITATDLATGEGVVFDSGDIWGPLAGSFSIPAVFRAVRVGDRYLADGGMSIPVPVQELYARGADRVIAVSLYDPVQGEPFQEHLGVAKLLERSLNLILHNVARPQLEKADLVIRPDLRGCSPQDVHEYVVRGYDAVMRQKAAAEALIA